MGPADDDCRTAARVANIIPTEANATRRIRFALMVDSSQQRKSRHIISLGVVHAKE
jgi:hypothetical protein